MMTVAFKVRDDDLAKIEAAAQQAGCNRSVFMRNAVLDAITSVRPREVNPPSPAPLPELRPVADPRGSTPQPSAQALSRARPSASPFGHAMTCKCWTCRPPEESP